MHRPNPGAGQHGYRSLGSQWHVYDHLVTLPDPQAPQPVGHPVDQLRKPPVGQHLLRPILPYPHEGRLILAAVFQMPVQAVVGYVAFAVREPLEVGVVPFERPGSRACTSPAPTPPPTRTPQGLPWSVCTRFRSPECWRFPPARQEALSRWSPAADGRFVFALPQCHSRSGRVQKAPKRPQKGRGHVSSYRKSAKRGIRGPQLRTTAARPTTANMSPLPDKSRRP